LKQERLRKQKQKELKKKEEEEEKLRIEQEKASKFSYDFTEEELKYAVEQITEAAWRYDSSLTVV
jgi:hypothetical protein